jgi:hypothetical protein
VHPLFEGAPHRQREKTHEQVRLHPLLRPTPSSLSLPPPNVPFQRTWDPALEPNRRKSLQVKI